MLSTTSHAAARRHENERQPEMTCRTAIDGPPARRRGLAERIRAAREQISSRAHAAGDAHALAMGWTITSTTGRLGISGRTYRDPRFDTRGRRRAA